jgi:hypothetical protein
MPLPADGGHIQCLQTFRDVRGLSTLELIAPTWCSWCLLQIVCVAVLGLVALLLFLLLLLLGGCRQLTCGDRNRMSVRFKNVNNNEVGLGLTLWFG